MWTLTPYAKSRLALPGVPWRNLTDEEYAAACERHPGMDEQGYFIQEAPEETLFARRGRRPSEETASPAEEVMADD